MKQCWNVVDLSGIRCEWGVPLKHADTCFAFFSQLTPHLEESLHIQRPYFHIRVWCHKCVTRIAYLVMQLDNPKACVVLGVGWKHFLSLSYRAHPTPTSIKTRTNYEDWIKWPHTRMRRVLIVLTWAPPTCILVVHAGYTSFDYYTRLSHVIVVAVRRVNVFFTPYPYSY